MTIEPAILAGGCFWGMQALFRRYDGVLSTRVGYTGGDVPNATYRNHGNHAEAIEITFDPAKISYRRILEFHFQIHDPSTTLLRFLAQIETQGLHEQEPRPALGAQIDACHRSGEMASGDLDSCNDSTGHENRCCVTARPDEFEDASPINDLKRAVDKQLWFVKARLQADD